MNIPQTSDRVLVINYKTPACFIWITPKKTDERPLPRLIPATEYFDLYQNTNHKIQNKMPPSLKLITVHSDIDLYQCNDFCWPNGNRN